jgi:SAM-dependent methyltransferase
MTDKECYAEILSEKFDYTNTYYDREPRFDITESHPRLSSMYDFILSADVLEHIAPPVDRVLTEVHQLLKPHGFLGVTVYCNPSDRMREHFPELNEYRVIPLGTSSVLINRRRDGSLEIIDNLIFHRGSGATLEMREFGITELQTKLLAAGFRGANFLTTNVPENGILFDHDTSQPLIARKGDFVLDRCAQNQLVDALRAAQRQTRKERDRADLLAKRIRLACESRWLRFGRKLGAGPDFGKLT